MGEQNTLGMGKVYLTIFFIFLSSVYSALSFRPESFDGAQALFQMLNSQPYLYYINHRKLGFVLQYASYLIDTLTNLGLKFETIYYLVVFSIALNPVIIIIILLLILTKTKRYDAIPFTILNYALAVYPTQVFHMSLVPETILFAWGAFMAWCSLPKNVAGIILGGLGIIFLFLFISGYEGVLLVSVIFGTHYIYLIFKDHIPLITKGYFSIRDPLVFTYRTFFILILILYGAFRLNNLPEGSGVSISSFYAILHTMPLTFIFQLSSIFILTAVFFTKRFFYVSLLIFPVVIGGSFFVWGLRNDGVDSGFYLRVFSPFMCMACMSFYLFAGTRKNLNKYLLNLSLVILFISFVFDLEATHFWSEHRTIQQAELTNYGNGCHKIRTEDWTAGYRAIFYQSTFQPTYLIFPDEKSTHLPFKKGMNLCKVFNSENKIKVPHGFSGEKVKNFDFLKVKF